MKRLFFAAIAVLALWGCGDSSTLNTEDDTRHDEEVLDTGVFPSDYFITEYIVPSKIEVKDFSGKLCLAVSGSQYRTCVEDENKDTPNFKKAMEFAEFYGDTSYEGSVYPGMSKSLAYPIEKITISCYENFDAEHPAGEPLDDIVKLEYKTFYEYVKNGYKNQETTPVGVPDGWGEIDKFLCFNTIKTDYATLVFLHSTNATIALPIIRFASAPTEPGEYYFVLETTINGEVFKSEFAYTFESE